MAKGIKPGKPDKSSSKKPASPQAPAASPAAGSSAPSIDIGISPGDRKKIAEGLSRFLADSYTLYLKTHNFHWNVTGPMFNALHVMFETQYTEQWAALDDVARPGCLPHATTARGRCAYSGRVGTTMRRHTCPS